MSLHPAPGDGLSVEFRIEAIHRLFLGLGTASLDNGTSLKNCLVPLECIDASSGEIIPEKNTYKQIRVCGRNYGAHVLALMLAHNRLPIRDRGASHNEVGMHLCNNPACRSIDHIRFGTSQEDSAYKVKCGRAPLGPSNGHATKPDRTFRGDLLPQTKLREPMRTIVRSLIKKYLHRRGYAKAIAAYCGTTIHQVYNERKSGRWKDSPDTDIELEFPRWKRRERSVGENPIRAIVSEIRRRFHETPIAERSQLLHQFETEFRRSDVWIRQVLNRKIYPDVAPEIPVPTDFGIGRRKLRGGTDGKR